MPLYSRGRLAPSINLPTSCSTPAVKASSASFRSPVTSRTIHWASLPVPIEWRHMASMEKGRSALPSKLENAWAINTSALVCSMPRWLIASAGLLMSRCSPNAAEFTSCSTFAVNARSWLSSRPTSSNPVSGDCKAFNT